jgi:hypothetical protein
MHMEFPCTYAHFKSGLYNAHPTVSHFFTDEPSHHPPTCSAMSYERWDGGGRVHL